MGAARFSHQRDVRVSLDVPTPTLTPGNGRVLVDFEWCAICGSDLHEYLTGPVTLTCQHLLLAIGHELCGRVRNPVPVSRFKDGEVVTVDSRILCGRCHPCHEQWTHGCAAFGSIGGTVSGGFGEQIAVQEEMLHSLKGIPLECMALVEPLSVVYHAVKQTWLERWEEMAVLILDKGPIGFALTVDLRSWGRGGLWFRSRRGRGGR